MDEVTTQRKYPESVQPGIPRLPSLKPGWQRRKIGELLKEVSRPLSMDDSASYNLVTVKRSRGGVVKRDTKKGKNIAVKSQFTVRQGDFLISKRQIVHGACGIVPANLDGSIVSNEYSVLHCRELLDSRFLNYLTHTVYFQQTCFHSSIGVHIEKMIFKLGDWFKWKIDVPPIAEQREIADFLRTVDGKLDTLRRQRDLLQAYKRGMMQKIFSQELRFKADDGGEFPAWEVIDACKTFKNHSNKAHNGTLPILAITQENGAILRDQVEKTILSSKESITSYKIVEKGDFIISLRSFQGGIEYSQICGICSPAYTILKPVLPIYDGFYRHYFKHPDFIKRLSATTVGIREGKQVSYSAFGKLKLYYPEIAEQQKIADFLSAIDAKIEAVAGQIEKMTLFKKGLLQQMFC